MSAHTLRWLDVRIRLFLAGVLIGLCASGQARLAQATLRALREAIPTNFGSSRSRGPLFAFQERGFGYLADRIEVVVLVAPPGGLQRGSN